MERCTRCNRRLRDPESKLYGLGPRCREMDSDSEESVGYQVPLFDYPELPFKGNVILKRDDIRPVTNVIHRDKRYSHFDWGHDCAAAADLALNILLMFTDEKTAEILYPRFTYDFLVYMPYAGGTILGNTIRKWIREET